MVRDTERDEWLSHLRTWGAALVKAQQPAYGSNWQRLNAGALEAAAHATPGCLTRWWNATLRGAGKTPARISRADYLRLCPWLAAWYDYAPPTRNWQF